MVRKKIMILTYDRQYPHIVGLFHHYNQVIFIGTFI